MIHCLEALNPFSFCITALDYEDSLIEIESILKGLDAAPLNDFVGPDQRQKRLAWLEKAYAIAMANMRGSGHCHPDKPLSLLLAEICKHAALLSIDTNPFTSRQLLLCALNLHLNVIGLAAPAVHFRDFSSLEQLQSTIEHYPRFFSAFESQLATHSAERCAALTHVDAFVHPERCRRLNQLSETASLLLRCYRETADDEPSQDKETDPVHLLLFKLGESLLLLANDESSKIPLARHYLEASDSMIDGACEPFLKLAETCDPSREMGVRTNMRRFLANSNSLKHLLDAFSTAEKLDESPSKEALLAELSCHYSGVFLQPGSLDLAEAEKLAAASQKYADQCRTQGNDHLHFARFDMRTAEVKMIQGSFNDAAVAVKRALDTLQGSTHSFKSTRLKAQAMQQFIAAQLHQR